MSEQSIADDRSGGLGKPVNRVQRGKGVYLYHQGHCRRCGSATEVIDLGGRRMWACPRGQPDA